MTVCPGECLWYDMDVARAQETPLCTQAAILSRAGDMVLRICMGCNATCEIWEPRDNSPQYERNDERGLRNACALPGK